MESKESKMSEAEQAEDAVVNQIQTMEDMLDYDSNSGVPYTRRSALKIANELRILADLVELLAPLLQEE
jgi:hypothetical protein